MVELYTKSVAVIGCGHWGRNLVRNFHALGGLAAVCDTDPRLAESQSSQYGVPALGLQQILADKSITAVVIAAPAELHYELSKAAISAGKHVYVEKPLALDVGQAESLCALADKCQVGLMVGHLLQYHPAFLKLKDLVREGKLGRINYIYSNRLNLGKFRREENILWSFAPHDISMILSLAGEQPDGVLATGSSYLHSQIADVTTTHLSFPSGINAHIFVSWLHPFKEQKLVVVGSDGMAVFDDGQPWESKLLLYPHRIEWIDGSPRPTKADAISIELAADEPLKLECAHFLDCVTHDRQPRTDGREGLAVLRVLAAAQAALDKSSGKKAKTAVPEGANYFVHPSSYVDEPCVIGEGSKIWHFSHILGNVTIGKSCNIGQNVVIGPDVTIGDRCKIQNNVSVYKGVTLEDGVFCGPSCVFTNVNTPRAEIERKNEYLPTLVKRGASIGANATIVCGSTIGEYAFIAAGAVVTKNVSAFALMAGVPARQIGWVGRSGDRLGDDLVCPRTGERYKLSPGNLLEPVSGD